MAEPMLRIEVAYALPRQQWLRSVELPAGSHAIEAVRASGLVEMRPELAGIELDLGIFPAGSTRGTSCRMATGSKSIGRCNVIRCVPAACGRGAEDRPCQSSARPALVLAAGAAAVLVAAAEIAYGIGIDGLGTHLLVAVFIVDRVLGLVALTALQGLAGILGEEVTLSTNQNIVVEGQGQAVNGRLAAARQLVDT